MQRLVALIALVFAFASLAGATTAHAHRYVSTPIVVLNHVDAENTAIPVLVSVQRGEIDLGSGIVMPCGPHHAIPVEIAGLPQVAPATSLPLVLDADEPASSGIDVLRPPRAA